MMPPICTGITPTVLATILFSISLGSIDKFLLEMSANITFAPACIAARGVAIKVLVGIITDLPLTFKALSGISRALVPLLTATANLTPINSAKSSSK